MCLGAYLGILCDTRFFRGTHREIHNTSCLKSLLRLLITLIIFSPLIITVHFIQKDASFPEVIFVVYIIPSFVVGFIFFAFSRLIFQRCKLVASDVDRKNAEGGKLNDQGDNLSDFSYDSEDADHRSASEMYISETRSHSRLIDTSHSEADDSHCGVDAGYSERTGGRAPSSALFIRNDVTAFKSKKDFAAESDENST